MRLPAVERPPNPLLQLAYWFTKRRYGKVIAPLKVIYARKPGLAVIAQQITGTLERGLVLEAELRLLISAFVSQLNGCAFCSDLALAQAVQKRLGTERFRALAEFRDSGLFTERERAALRFAEEATQHRKVSDATFAGVREHFSDQEIVELTWVNAVENYFNLQASVLELGSDELLSVMVARGKRV